VPIPGDDTGYPLYYIFPLYHTPVPPKKPPRATPTPTYRPPPEPQVEPTRGFYRPTPSNQRFPSFRTQPLEATNRELRLLLGLDARAPIYVQTPQGQTKKGQVVTGLAPTLGRGRIVGDVASSKAIGAIIAGIVGIYGAIGGPGKSEQRTRGRRGERGSGVLGPAGAAGRSTSLGSVLGRVFAHTSNVTRAAQRSATAAAATNKAAQRPQPAVVRQQTTGETSSTPRPKPFAKPSTVPPDSPNAYKIPSRSTQGQRSPDTRSSAPSSGPASSPLPSTSSTAFTPPGWWQYVQDAINLLKKPPATPRAKQPKSATPTAPAGSLTGDVASLTGVNTGVSQFSEPFASPYGAPRVPTDNKQCECEPKKKRKKSSCTNKVISRVTANGIRTTKTRITCPPSKQK